MDPIEFRNLDYIYFRIERDGVWKNICFSDLSEEEMDKVISNLNKENLRTLCKILGSTIRKMGDSLDIVRKEESWII